jgi:hypothetical protein
MRRSQQLSSILRSGGLSLHAKIGRIFGVGFAAQCWLVTVLMALVIVTASAIDGSLILGGQDLGLLQHPGIWAFFCLQIALPITMRGSLVNLLASRIDLVRLGALTRDPQEQIKRPFLRFVSLEDPLSRFIAVVTYGFGLTAFVWNTYQNQRPGIIVPHDFWDSKNFVYGFWITRLYKLYLFGWFLPYLGMLHVGMLVVGLSLIRLARRRGELKLLPFHPDGVAGLGFLPDIVTRPLVIAVLFGLLPTVGAFLVHRSAAVTPIMGASALILAVMIAYFVPILNLRADIIASKRHLVERLRWLQQESFSQIADSRQPNVKAVKTANETIDNYEKLCTAVSAVSNYPHLKRLVGFVAVAMTPTATALLTQAYEHLSPVVRHWIRNP